MQTYMEEFRSRQYRVQIYLRLESKVTLIDRTIMAVKIEQFYCIRIEELQQDKHPITPGSTGENLTIRGLDWACLEENTILQIGEVKLQLRGVAPPCPGIRESFFDYAWTVCRDRWCARVLTEALVNFRS